MKLMRTRQGSKVKSFNGIAHLTESVRVYRCSLHEKSMFKYSSFLQMEVLIVQSDGVSVRASATVLIQ